MQVCVTHYIYFIHSFEVQGDEYHKAKFMLMRERVSHTQSLEVHMHSKSQLPHCLNRCDVCV